MKTSESINEVSKKLSEMLRLNQEKTTISAIGVANLINWLNQLEATVAQMQKTIELLKRQE